MRGLSAIAGLALVGYGTYRIDETLCCLVVGGIMLAIGLLAAVVARTDIHARDSKPDS